MKTTICSAILLLTLVSCNVDPTPLYRTNETHTSKRMAEQVITALQNRSAEEYISMFPALREFHEIMEANSDAYGESLSAARQEFATTYESRLMRDAKDAFGRVLDEGDKRGITWSTIRLERVDAPKVTRQFAHAQVSIVFTANGQRHRLILEKALILNSQWKVSQFIKLI